MIRPIAILSSIILLFSLNCSPPVEKLDDGLVIKTSSNSVDSTYQKLHRLISDNPNLSIVAELDHQKNAASVDLELPPTRIILFGNPKLGTPLMQQSQTAGIDLPQKMLVYEEDGVVKIAYNDPEYLLKRHKLTNLDNVLSTMSKALDNLSEMASK
ncbi:MAG: DUF302 domain-containing protein [Balneola sp.]